MDMVDCTQFETLRQLRIEVLNEVTREGETRLQAHLDIATAADQRALTIAGFQIAAATGALAGGVALIIGHNTERGLATLAICFAFAMALCAAFAISTVVPKKEHIPGNRPAYWLPANWMDGAKHRYSVKQAKIEQAACLDEAIAENETASGKAAKRIRWSIGGMVLTVLVASCVLGITLLRRGDLSPSSPKKEIIAGKGSAKHPIQGGAVLTNATALKEH